MSAATKRVYDFTRTSAVFSCPENDPLVDFLNFNRDVASQVAADDFKLSFIRRMRHQPDMLTWFYRHKKTKDILAITSSLECYVREDEQIVEVSPSEALSRVLNESMAVN